MTSEIVILTPSAVALAADSAVTLGGKKTYNGVNKLFMLSNNPPMGIMFYNLSEFFNIPLETIIKEFRKSIKNDEELKTVQDFQDRFKIFLENMIQSNKEDSYFEENIINFVNMLINETKGWDTLNFRSFVNQIASNLDYSIFNDYYDEIIEKLNKNEDKFSILLQDITDDNEKKSFLESLKKFFLQDLLNKFTGIVIAGFNEDDLFPSFIEFNIISLFDDKFILYNRNDIKLLRKEVHIISLAQGDVINTFLKSIDDETEKEIVNYFDSIHNNYIKNIENAISFNPNFTDDEKSKISSEISKIARGNSNLTRSFVTFIKKLKDEHSGQILTNIGHLPKDELSNLAESLINLTSLKRKVQTNLETVGGPVDVAIITKGDGFIWTKRKHYFDAGLNPQFFERD